MKPGKDAPGLAELRSTTPIIETPSTTMPILAFLARTAGEHVQRQPNWAVPISAYQSMIALTGGDFRSRRVQRTNMPFLGRDSTMAELDEPEGNEVNAGPLHTIHRRERERNGQTPAFLRRNAGRGGKTASATRR